MLSLLFSRSGYSTMTLGQVKRFRKPLLEVLEDRRLLTVFHDNFDDAPTGELPPGWPILRASGGATALVDDTVFVGPSGKSLHFSDSGGGGEIVFLVPLGQQLTTAVLEYDMRTHNTSFEGAFLQLDGDGDRPYGAAFGAAFGGGMADRIGIIGPGTWPEPDLLQYTVDTWYHVRHTVDTLTKTITFGVYEIDNPSNSASFSTVDSQYNHTYIDKIVAHTSFSQGADSHIDNVSVTTATTACSDFSVDPGLETNNGDRYFISGGVFEANTFTNSQEYGTFPVTYGGESFVLTFDIEILSRTSGDGDIGLFSSSRKGSQGPGAPDSTIFVIYGGFEKGLGLRGVDADGAFFSLPSGGLFNPFDLNTVYHNEVTYDATTLTATLSVSSPTNPTFFFGAVSIPGGLPSFPHLGVSSVGSWTTSGRFQQAQIDNLCFSASIPEPPSEPQQQKISDTQGDFTDMLDNNDWLGHSVTSLGDFDDDGVTDLAVGAVGDDDGGSDRGAVWLLFLNADGTVKSQQKISDTQGNFTGTLDNLDYFGSSVTSLGDLDGDGVTDLAVAADGDDDDGGDRRGAVWVLFLNADGTVKSQQKISESQGNFTGTLDNNDIFGVSITSLGDLNGDGLTDLAVGALADDDGGFDRGAVWVLFLNDDGTVKSQQKISDTQGNFTGTLDDADLFGNSVTNLGDLDGDGVTDLAVGAFGDDDGGTIRGAVWVLFLNVDGTVKGHQKISDTQGNFTGTLDDNDYFGSSVTSLGDLDGNGVTDLAVGARWDDDGGTGISANRGAVWVLFLNADGTVKGHQKISDTQGNFTGTLDDIDLFGTSVAGLGDLDGDGVTDLAVGALGDDDGGSDRGAVWVLFLTASNQAPTANAGGPYPVPEGGSTNLSGSGTDPDNDPLTFTWDLDNNGSFETAEQNPTFSAIGRDGPDSQTVVLQVCDPSNACATSNATVTINNADPTANANGPYLVDEGSSVALSGTGSDPAAADTLTFAWDLDNDGAFETPGQNVSFDATLRDGPDNQVVVLQVCDDDEACATRSTTVTVNNVPPTVDAGPNKEVSEGEVVKLGSFGGDLLLAIPNPRPNMSSQADEFGGTVAAWGENLVVGAHNDDSCARSCGVVHVFNGDSGVRDVAPLLTLENPSPDTGDKFGYRVATEGAKIITSAINDHRDGNAGGAVYIFDGDTGDLLISIPNPTPAGGDNFGFALDVEAGRAVVGAHDDDTYATSGGIAYVFDTETGDRLLTFPDVTNPTHPNLANGDTFGRAVAMVDGDILIGAPFANEGASDAGIAYLFDGATGDLVRTIPNPSPESGDHFGYTVAAFGSGFAVTARDDHSNGNAGGAVYLFDGSTSPYLTIPNPSPAPGDFFGFSLAEVNGNLLVGARPDDTFGSDAGAAYLFDGVTGDLLLAFPDPDNPTHLIPSPGSPHGNFGDAVAGVGSNILVGARLGHSGSADAGAAYLFAGPADFARFTDPAAAATETFSATVNWGDGTAETAPVEWITGGPGILTRGTIDATHVYGDDGAYTVTVTVCDDDGGCGSDSFVVTVNNVTPTATLSNDGPVNEGTTVAVTFSNQFDPSTADTNAGFHYAYDVDNNGTFEVGDGTYLGSGTNDSETVPASFLADGPGIRTVKGRILDKDGGFTDYTTSITIDNVAPEITSLSSSNETVENKSGNGNVTIDGLYFDPAGDLDTHTVKVDWGDGSVLETLTDVDQDADTFAGSHSYEDGGIFTITVTVEDEDGGVSLSETTTAVITGVGLVDRTLYVIGTNDKDQVQVSLDNQQLKIQAQLLDGDIDIERFVNVGEVSQIVIVTCEEEDQVQIAEEIVIPAFIAAGSGKDQIQTGDGDTTVLGGDGDDQIQTGDGDNFVDSGAGDDQVQTSDGNDVVQGGAGNDKLEGGKGRDLLIGGLGADELVGDEGQDILIGGSTDADDDDDALLAVLAAWTSNDAYGAREAAVDALLSVSDDEEEDKLTGSSELDLFYDGLGDILTDVENVETVL